MTKKSRNKPTPEQIDFIIKCIEKHQVRLNLQDWRIEKSSKPASKGAMADVDISYGDRLAVIAVGNDWGGVKIDDTVLNATALHEVLHVFLRPLIEAARSRDDEAIEAAEHSVVVILEKLLA